MQLVQYRWAAGGEYKCCVKYLQLEYSSAKLYDWVSSNCLSSFLVSFSCYPFSQLLTGEAGKGPTQFILSSNGLSSFNKNPTVPNINEAIKSLNNDTTVDSGFFATSWSAKLSDALTKQQSLKSDVDATVVTTIFPGGSTSDEFEMVVSPKIFSCR